MMKQDRHQKMTVEALRGSLRLPVIAAPMLLVSGPDLVIAACKSGVVGSFPTLNARTAAECEAWVERIIRELGAVDGPQRPAPFAMNIIVRSADPVRLEADVALAERVCCSLVITSVGNPAEVVKRVHAYGGLVFHDVATMVHAQKAIAAGVDGLILLSYGAGGHTGNANPFAFVRNVRKVWDGVIVLAGGIGDGHAVRAAEVLGADFAYMGTRFAATRESMASEEYKQLLVSQELADVLVTDRISGLNATFMRGSISRVGLDPDDLPPAAGLFRPNLPDGLKAWRDIWSAGHGVGLIHDIPGVAELATRLADEYQDACLGGVAAVTT
jgi:nitronate monooxygenase